MVSFAVQMLISLIRFLLFIFAFISISSMYLLNLEFNSKFIIYIPNLSLPAFPLW